MGGCSASTSGGIKVFRLRFMLVDLSCSLRSLIHPRAVLASEYGVKNEGHQIRGYLNAFVLFFFCLVALLMFFGLDLAWSVATITACITNTGAAIGGVSRHYAELSAAVKGVLMLTMIVGRVEILAILVLITRGFWQ